MDTPFYTFNIKKIRDNYDKISNLLSSCKINYSTKANSDFTLLESMISYVNGFEVCSEKEFDFFCSKNYDASKLCYGIPIKDKKCISRLYNKGCRYFVFASENELIKLSIYAPSAKKIMRISVDKFATNSIKYGMDIESVTQDVINQTDGFLFHISNANINDHIEALNRIEKCIVKYNKNNCILNIGGSYYKNDDNFLLKLNERLEELKNRYGLIIYAEPGSAIINTAGTLNTKVLHIEPNGKAYDVYIDAGVPSGVYCTPEQIINLTSKCKDDSSRYIYRFIDTTCLKNILFIKILNYKILDEDILQFVNYGAYSLCYINRFHNLYDPNIKYIETGT